MSFEEIISEIQNKPEIWMSKHPLYKKKLVKAKIWQELARKLEIEAVQNKPDWNQTTSNDLIIDWLLNPATLCQNAAEVDYPSYDGWYHNLEKVDLGSIGQPLVKEWTETWRHPYQAQDISDTWNKLSPSSNFCTADSNALLIFLSKQVVSEVLDINIPNCIMKNVDSSLPLNIINHASSFIDGGAIYGNAYSIKKYIIPNTGIIDVDRLFTLELEEQNSDDINIPFFPRIIWLRWHNRLAEKIQKHCTHWKAGKVFNEARKWTIAVQQSVYAYEWLPHFINKNLTKYIGYNPAVDPQSSKLFQAAMSIPQSVVKTKLPFCKKEEETDCLYKNNTYVDKFVKEWFYWPCQNFSTYEGIQNNSRSVWAWQIFSAAYYLSDSMNSQTYLSKQSLKIIDNIRHNDVTRDGLKELFAEVILEQFRRIRDGDRFWFENMTNNMLSSEEVVKIKQMKMIDLVFTVTNLTFKDVKSNSSFKLINGTVKYFANTRSNNKTCLPEIHYNRCPFILLGLIISGTLGTVIGFIYRQKMKARALEEQECDIVAAVLQKTWRMSYPLFSVKEITDTHAPESYRWLVVILKKDGNQIILQSFSGIMLRVIDLNTVSEAEVIKISDEPITIIRFPHTYDLVLRFASFYLQKSFHLELNVFFNANIQVETTSMKWNSIKSIAKTKEHRQKSLEMFFRVAFAQAFKIKHSRSEILNVDTHVAKEVIYTDMTLVEFAEGLNMNPNDEFVKKMFTLVDTDMNGLISFREFVDLIILFAEGSNEEKAKLFFALYDINGTGLVDVKDFSFMIRSFLSIVRGATQNPNAQKSIDRTLRSWNLERKHALDFNDFKKVIRNYLKYLDNAHLDPKIHSQDDNSYLVAARNTIKSLTRKSNDSPPRSNRFGDAVDKTQATTIRPSVPQSNLCRIHQLLELHSKQIFCLVFVTLFILFVFVEKVYRFIEKNQLSGISGVVFGISRGSKHAILLTYAFFLLRMCTTILLKLRNTFANTYFPFDAFFDINIYMAYVSTIFTVFHIVAEILFFYDIPSSSFSQQKHSRNTNEFNKSPVFWLDPVVISGFCLAILHFFMFILCVSHRNGKLKNIIYFTPYLHFLTVIIIVLHGSESQNPLTHLFLLGPILLFFSDLIISIHTKKMELPVIRTEKYPSNVICLVLRRPNFQYKVGQLIRLAVSQISRQEFHLLAISAAPHDQYLRVYVPPTNPWALQVRSLFEGPGSKLRTVPIRVLLDGPYGSGAHQWRLYDVVILVAGGNGVEPFSSLLRFIRNALQDRGHMNCKKVYFIWVTKTQKHFEWFVDLIQEVEENDLNQRFSCHIFLTEFYENFDLRTLFLYIFEKYYQRLSGKCIFTNIEAVTHFGHPDLFKFIDTVGTLCSSAKQIGVFSCGPIFLSQRVDEVCSQLNSLAGKRFHHHINTL